MTKDELKSYIESNYSNYLTYLESGKYDLHFEFKADQVKEICQKLRGDEQLKFDYLCNMHGVDTGERFEMVYNLASTVYNIRIDLKTTFSYDNAEIESVQDIWPAANWYEREAWELYGFNILNHGNLKRFLLPDDWDQGHPMRKDWDAPDFIRFPEL